MTDQGMKRPDHMDDDGPWWSLPELPQWWARQGVDGTLTARHRILRRCDDRPDGVADVTVGPGARGKPRLYLLVAICYGANAVAPSLHDLRGAV